MGNLDEKRSSKIKKRGKDGNKIIPVRIREETLAELAPISSEANDSHNELINLILAHDVENLQIDDQRICYGSEVDECHMILCNEMNRIITVRNEMNRIMTIRKARKK